MELRQLRAFVILAEELSFRRAAERLHMSQPPLSRLIKTLEDELGVRLLERDRASKISLTDAGQSFLADTRRTLAQTEAARGRAQEAERGERGRLNIANNAALSADVLPRLLCSFREQFPQVQISLIEMTRNEPLPALQEGRIHVGMFPDLGEPLDRHFQRQPLFSCPMVAVLPARHKLAKVSKSDLSVTALKNETILVPAARTSPGYFDRLNQLCAVTHFTPAAIQPAEGLHNLLGLVAAGYGVAILPEVLLSSPRAGWVTRRLRAPVPPFQLSLYWLRKSPSLVLQNFLAVARDLANESDSGQRRYATRRSPALSQTSRRLSAPRDKAEAR